MKRRCVRNWVVAFVLFLGIGVLTACVQSPARFGMVKDRSTGLQYGSVIDRTFITDPSFFKNNRLKIRMRNTSGDSAFDLRRFTNDLESAFAANGYEPTRENDFGLLVDVNVKYSGQVQRNLAKEYALLGAAGGGIAGAAKSGDTLGALGGTLAGASFGAVAGSFVTEDTYIIVAHVTVGIIKESRKSASKKIIFSRSFKPHEDEEGRLIKEEERTARRFKKTLSTDVSVFAGGTNVAQSRIADEVRRRLIRIVGDII